MIKTGIFGIINVGASAFRMVIVELKNGRVKELEYLVKPLRLGLDTFSMGYITLERVKRATAILQGFKQKLDEYQIEDYRAVCTSGVREASNKEFFIDYARIHSGIELEILEPADEVYIKYLATKEYVKGFNEMERNGVVFANIASGNVSLSVSKGAKILYSGTLPYGSLRLRQMFKHVPSIKRYKAFNQYSENMIKTVMSAVDSSMKVPNLVAGGSSITMLVRLFKPEENYLLKKDIENMYSQYRGYSDDELISALNIRTDEAAVLIPTLTTYIQLLKYTGADRVSFNMFDFPTMLATYYSGNMKDTNYTRRVTATLLHTAERYHCNLEHLKKITRFALKLFEGLSEIHSMPNDVSKILTYAAILHETGYFIDTKSSAQNSYFIVKSLSVPGVSNRDLFLVACTVYQMIKRTSDEDITHLHEIAVKDLLLINKLASILRIANVLDASKSELIDDFDIELTDNEIVINARTFREPFVEIVSFDAQKQMFVETFGIPIELNTKVRYE